MALLRTQQDSSIYSLPGPDWTLILALALVFGFQKLIPAFSESYKDWYPNLRKPSWTPPGWVFPVVWIPLKILQSVAIWICWEVGKPSQLTLPVALFLLHLQLGNWWNVVFFGRHKLQESLYWMLAFWLSIAACIGAFTPLHPVAAGLMVPTQIWVTIAAKLNYDIFAVNSKGRAP